MGYKNFVYQDNINSYHECISDRPKVVMMFQEYARYRL